MTNSSAFEGLCAVDCMVGQALDGMCVGLVMMNPAGRVTWMNRSAERVLGLDREGGIGKLLTHVLKDPQFADFWHRASEVDTTVMGEVSVHWPRPAELKVNATACLGKSGEPLGRALLFCDVTHDRVVQIQLSQEATRKLLDLAGTHAHDATAAPLEGLTAQELRVLRRVGAGLGNSAIAGELHISPSTVRTHLKHVYSKLGLSSRSEAIRYALENGLQSG